MKAALTTNDPIRDDYINKEAFFSKIVIYFCHNSEISTFYHYEKIPYIRSS